MVPTRPTSYWQCSIFLVCRATGCCLRDRLMLDVWLILFARQSLACFVTGCCLRYRNGFPCNVSRLEEIPSLIAPGFREEPRACIIQTQALLFSCTGTSPSAMRLCPCRRYKKGQVALCDGCWHQSRLIYCGKKNICLFSEAPFTVKAQG